MFVKLKEISNERVEMGVIELIYSQLQLQQQVLGSQVKMANSMVAAMMNSAMIMGRRKWDEDWWG